MFSRSRLLLLAGLGFLLVVNPYLWSHRQALVTMLVVAIPFYALLISVSLYLRRPGASAVAWLALRAALFGVFLVLGMIKGGDEGFMLLFWHTAPDVLFGPLCGEITTVTDGWFGGHAGDHRLYLFVFFAWYGGGGYLVGRWAEERWGAPGSRQLSASRVPRREPRRGP